MVQAFNTPAFPVDTHIHRLALRWGLTKNERNASKCVPVGVLSFVKISFHSLMRVSRMCGVRVGSTRVRGHCGIPWGWRRCVRRCVEKKRTYRGQIGDILSMYHPSLRDVW